MPANNGLDGEVRPRKTQHLSIAEMAVRSKLQHLPATGNFAIGDIGGLRIFSVGTFSARGNNPGPIRVSHAGAVGDTTAPVIQKEKIPCVK